MIYELRTYDCVPQRQDALIKRLGNHTYKFFEKHGINVIGYWKPWVGVGTNSRVTYMCQFEDAAARDRAWKAFFDDPQFWEMIATSQLDGPIVSTIANELWTPLPFSPLR